MIPITRDMKQRKTKQSVLRQRNKERLEFQKYFLGLANSISSVIKIIVPNSEEDISIGPSFFGRGVQYNFNLEDPKTCRRLEIHVFDGRRNETLLILSKNKTETGFDIIKNFPSLKEFKENFPSLKEFKENVVIET